MTHSATTTLLLLVLVAASAQASSTRKLLAQAPQTLSGGRRGPRAAAGLAASVPAVCHICSEMGPPLTNRAPHCSPAGRAIILSADIKGQPSQR